MDKKEKPLIKLTGTDGNAWAIMGNAMRGLKRAGYTKEEIDQYQKEAMSGDYGHLLQVTMEWCDVE
jgi:hypothetical protein